MRIAIALSGEPRNYPDFCEIFRCNLENQGVEVEYYCHTWFGEAGISSLPEHVDRAASLGVDPSWYQGLLSVAGSGQYLDLIRPVKFCSELWDAHPAFSEIFTRISDAVVPRQTKQRMISMFYGIQSAMRLVDLGRNYDIVVRARPDIFFERKVNWALICEGLKSNYDVVIPDLYYNVGGWPGSWSPAGQYAPDFFWAFRPDCLSTFQQVFDEIPKLCSFRNFDIVETRPGQIALCPEIFLMNYLNIHKLRVGKLNNKMMLSRQYVQIRDHGRLIAY